MEDILTIISTTKKARSALNKSAWKHQISLYNLGHPPQPHLTILAGSQLLCLKLCEQNKMRRGQRRLRCCSFDLLSGVRLGRGANSTMIAFPPPLTGRRTSSPAERKVEKLPKIIHFGVLANYCCIWCFLMAITRPQMLQRFWCNLPAKVWRLEGCTKIGSSPKCFFSLF